MCVCMYACFGTFVCVYTCARVYICACACMRIYTHYSMANTLEGGCDVGWSGGEGEVDGGGQGGGSRLMEVIEIDGGALLTAMHTDSGTD